MFNRTVARGSDMQSLRNVVMLVTLLVSAGCAQVQPLVLDEPIGPLTWKPDTSRGSLVVYTDTEASSLDPADYVPRSDYQLYTAENEFLRTVNNRSRSSLRDPVTVDLPVGRYTVIARLSHFGRVRVPVVIQGGRTTVVDLTREVLSRATAANGDWVRLPNGQVIGSRSE